MISNGTLRLLFSVAALGAIAGCVAVGTAPVHGSAEGGWVYQYIWPLTQRTIEMFAAAAAISLALCAIPADVSRRHEWAVVLVWIFAAGHPGPAALTDALNVRTGLQQRYSQLVLRSNAAVQRRPLLGDFDRLRASLTLHAQSNMPGKLLFVAALRLLSERPAIMAWLVVVVSNLGGVFIYLARDLFNGDRRVGLYSLALYLFVPAKLFSFPCSTR